MSKKDEIKTLTIEVIANEFTNKEKGNKFLAYKAIEKSGKLVDLKFRKVCASKLSTVEITDKTRFTIEVENNKINKEQNSIYPCYWVKEIKSIFLKEPDIDTIDDDLPF